MSAGIAYHILFFFFIIETNSKVVLKRCLCKTKEIYVCSIPSVARESSYRVLRSSKSSRNHLNSIYMHASGRV